MSATDVDQWLEKATGFYEAGDSEKAVVAADAVLKRDPANQSALWTKANALMGLGKQDEAIACYDVAAEAVPASAAALLMSKSEQLEWWGLLDEAVEAVGRAVEFEPQNMDYRGQYVSLLRRAARFEEALSQCELLLGREEDAESEWIETKGDILKALNRFDAAFELLEKEEARFQADDWTRWADNLRYDSNNAEALRYYERAIELDSLSASAWRGKGLSLYAEHRTMEAVNALEQAVEANPDDALCWVDKGGIHYDLHEMDEAQRCYDRALELDPPNVYANFNQGLLYEDAEQYDRAAEYYRRALEADPNFVDAMLGLGRCLEIAGQPAEAMETCDRGLALEPGSWKLLNTKGYFLLLQGQREQALELLDDALSSLKGEADRWPILNKAATLREMGRYDECEELLRNAMEEGSSYFRARVLGSLGALLAEVRHKEGEAHERFLEAHELSQGAPETKANLAESFLRIGEYQRAREHAVAARAKYNGPSICAALSFIVLASYILEGNFLDASREFRVLETNLRKCGTGRRREWDFTSLTEISQRHTPEPLTRLVLLTLIDIQTGQVPIARLSYFAEMGARIAPVAASVAVS